MQRWEYCSLWRREGAPERWFLTSYGTETAADRELRPDADVGERSLRGVWGRTIAQLGHEGWELVAVDAAGFYFKRPAVDERRPKVRDFRPEASRSAPGVGG